MTRLDSLDSTVLADELMTVVVALTGRQNVALFAHWFDVPRARRREVVDVSLESVGLADAADRTAGTYSGGMIRRLELAQALVNAPQLLVLDEPPIGLDPIGRASVWDRIADVRASTGMTVLVTTHYMDEADQHCDQVALMHRGRIRAQGTPAELKDRVGPGATLDDVFRTATGDGLASDAAERMRDVRTTRRTAHNPLKLAAMVAVVILGSSFFCCLSITIAGLVLTHDRLMGIGQAITMPLFFGSSALYPVNLMPGWLQVFNHLNPLGYEVDALRGLLIGVPAQLGLDFDVLILSSAIMISIASALLLRLAR